MRKLKTPAQRGTENRAIARLFLTDVEKHGGEESLMVQWARLVLKKPFVPRVTLVQRTLFEELTSDSISTY